MISYMISRLVIQVFGTLYPAYSSYKTVRTKNVKGYVQWMKYWIVFAFLNCVEPFCDFFLSAWVPFYYESKILIVAWLLCPATRGYNYLYRAFVHPNLLENEEYIDGLLNNVKEQWRQAVLQVGKQGSSMMIHTMLKGVLSRTTFGSCFQRSNSFTDSTFAYGELGEQAISYHHQHALIHTLFLAENRRNSDPNVFSQLHDSFNEKPSDFRCVELRRNSRGLANFESVRFLDDGSTILPQSISTESGGEIRAGYQTSGENLTLETLEEFDERIQNLPPSVNHRLACLARKLSLEGLTDEHIGTVVSTLISDLDSDVSSSSVEVKISPKADGSEMSLIKETSELKNLSQSHDDVSLNENESKIVENLEKLPTVGDSKLSRAGRYRKLPAPSPPESKKLNDFVE